MASKPKTADRIALIEHLPNGPRARFTVPATDEGRAIAEARIAHFVKSSDNEFSLSLLLNQPV